MPAFIQRALDERNRLLDEVQLGSSTPERMVEALAELDRLDNLLGTP